MQLSNDPFVDAEDRPRVLRGVAVVTGATRLAEMAGKIGFDTVWIEVEHGPASFSEVEALCVATEAGGAVPTVRLPDAERHHVLRALEVGARIVVVPLVNDAETARQIVQHGKFRRWGCAGSTRAAAGSTTVWTLLEAFEQANARAHLIAQIETLEAVQNLEAICSVPGLAGILIGPGDLSVSAGKIGDFTDPEMIDLVAGCMKRARAQGKHAGILVAPGPMLDAALAAGCDLVFCGATSPNLTRAWRDLLASMTTGAEPRV